MKKRILVVDDEPSVTLFLQFMFENTGAYEVKAENVSTKALAVARRFQPDLILLDVNMPGLDGGQLASRLAETPGLNNVPLVFMTGSVTREEVERRQGLIGGLPFVAKPLHAGEIFDCVNARLSN